MAVSRCGKESRIQSAVGPAGPWERPLSLQKGQDTYGTIPCAERILPFDFRSDTTAEVFKNLASKAVKGDTVVIVGHGVPGMICTGKGDKCAGTTAAVISAGNESDWMAYAQKLAPNKVDTVRLLACDVGADDLGAKLLHQIAKHVGSRVIGPTYLVHCKNGEVRLDPLAEWQEATPDLMPAPKLPKIPNPPITTVALQIGGRLEHVPWSEIQVFSLEVLDAADRSDLVPLSPADAFRLARMVDFASPYDPGPPFAIVTGHLTLRVVRPGGEVSKTFRIYADELLQDEQSPTMYYRASSDFAAALRQRRK